MKVLTKLKIRILNWVVFYRLLDAASIFSFRLYQQRRPRVGYRKITSQP